MEGEIISMKANINFIRLRLPAIIFSTLLILLGLWFIFGPREVNLGVMTPKGFNLGVDFQGGMVQQITIYSGLHQDKVREAAIAAGLGSDIQEIIIPQEKRIGNASSFLIKTMISDKDQKYMKDKGITSSKFLEDKSKKLISLLEVASGKTEYELTGEALKKVNNLYKTDFMHGEIESKKTDSLRVVKNVVKDSSNTTSPSYSQSNQAQGILLISFALLIIFLYVLVRFNFKFAIGGIFSTVHDTLVMVGFVAIFQLELDMTIIAAWLTLIGYSINDTIVIFDRVRENYRIMKDEAPHKIFNSSINQTLNRTIVTVTVTLTSVIALLIFGGSKLYGFSLVLLVGMIFGTYSSIFIAAPVVDLWDTMFSKKEKQRALKEKKKEEVDKAKAEVTSNTSNATSEVATDEAVKLETSTLSKSKLKKLTSQKKK
jgi:preprotein translocase SecF subunit